MLRTPSILVILLKKWIEMMEKRNLLIINLGIRKTETKVKLIIFFEYINKFIGRSIKRAKKYTNYAHKISQNIL